MASAEVLDRLRRLEESVFGSRNEANLQRRPIARHNGHVRYETAEPRDAASVTPTSGHDDEPHHVADLDYPHAGGPLVRCHLVCSLNADSVRRPKVVGHSDKLNFRIAAGSHRPGVRLVMDPSVPSKSGEETVVTVLLPTQEEALGHFQDYLHHSSYLLRIVHGPSTQAMITDAYSRLSDGLAADPGTMALLFAICATAAFFWNKAVDHPSRFDSGDDAAEASLAWRSIAWDLTDQSPRAMSASLESVQARMILADLLYNVEGCSARFRYLQSCAVASAHELSLHLVDSPAGGGKEDSPTTREVKRRVWWHLASTDWYVQVSHDDACRSLC